MLLQKLKKDELLNLARIGSSSCCTSYFLNYHTLYVQHYYRKADTNVHSSSIAHAPKKIAQKNPGCIATTGILNIF